MADSRAVIGLREYETRVVHGLAPEDQLALHASKALTVAPAVEGCSLSATQYVGAIQTAGIEVRIHPKVAVEQLLYLLGYAHDPNGWKEVGISVAGMDDLVSAVGHAFVMQAERALAAGVLQGYHTVDEAVTTLRGRVRVGDQLSRRFGMAVPAEVTYDEFDVDIPENQLLRGAIAVLSRLGIRDPALRRRLHRIDQKLWPATRATPGRHAAPRWSRLNQRYRSAVTLARVLLEGRSLRMETGPYGGRAFLFDMNKVFEDFLSAAMETSFRRYGGRLETQQVDYLDHRGGVTIKPDIVWRQGNRARAVADAKYKSMNGVTGPSSDVYQALAYATGLNLDRAWLVYAAGNEAPVCHAIRHSDIEIMVATIPLNRPRRDLHAAVDSLVDKMVRQGVAPPEAIAM